MLEDYIGRLREKRGRLQAEIDSAVENNKHLSELMKTYYTLSAKFGKLQDYYSQLFDLRRMVMVIMERRRDEVIQNLERRVESILGVILPEENFKIQITYTPRRGYYYTEVYIGKEDKNGNISWTRPRGTNGEFMKQLISFAILASINILLQSPFLFMDEPFSSSDVENVGKLRPIFELMLEQGLQLMFIEHKRELYESLDHRLIKLLKHRSGTSQNDGYVEVLSAERVMSGDQTEDLTDS